MCAKYSAFYFLCFVLTLCFFISCSTKDEHLAMKQSRFPFWNLTFLGFIVQKPNITDPPEHQLKLIPVEKKIILEALDTLKFIINTSEFSNAVLSTVFISSQDMSGPIATLHIGDRYDNHRLLSVIQKNTLSLAVQKSDLHYPILATGTVGQPLYVLSDNDSANFDAYAIMLQNYVRWDQYADYQDTGQLASIIFHEILHNLGFIHRANADLQDPIVKKSDLVYQLQEIVFNVYKDLKNNPHRMQELQDFRPFYLWKERKWLNFDTTIDDYPQDKIPNNQTVSPYIQYSMDIHGICSTTN